MAAPVRVSLPPPLLLLPHSIASMVPRNEQSAASPMARVLLPQRPPPPSESDDDTEESETEESASEDSESELEDEEADGSEPESEDEEAEESESETEDSESELEDQGLTLPVDAEAEVRSDAPGFIGSYYEVTVTSRGRRYYKVVYNTIEDDDGGPLEVTAPAADVRPRPPREGRRDGGFVLHDAVEARHKAGWWAGVVSAVLPPVNGRRPKVYQVAFPTSRETTEFEESALRPHGVFRDGRWVPAAEVEYVNPTMLTSLKRPISSILYSEDGEISDTHGSSHKKRLKSSDVESELTSPLLSVRKEPSSYTKETVKQGNVVFAPSSLPSMAGFAHLSDSLLAQSSDVEQAHSAPVPESRQLQISMFGTFGQPRPLPQGPLFGMQPLIPQTAEEGISAESIEEGISAESIEEARITVSMSEDGFDGGAIRSRLEQNSCSAEFHDAMKRLEEQIARKETDDKVLGARIRVMAMALHHVE